MVQNTSILNLCYLLNVSTFLKTLIKQNNATLSAVSLTLKIFLKISILKLLDNPDSPAFSLAGLLLASYLSHTKPPLGYPMHHAASYHSSFLARK